MLLIFLYALKICFSCIDDLYEDMLQRSIVLIQSSLKLHIKTWHHDFYLEILWEGLEYIHKAFQENVDSFHDYLLWNELKTYREREILIILILSQT